MQVDRNSASHSASVGIVNTALVQGLSVVGVSPEGNRDTYVESCMHLPVCAKGAG